MLEDFANDLLVKKILKSAKADQTQTISVRQRGTSAFGGARRLKPLSSMRNPRQKNNVDNKDGFRYLNGYWFRLIGASIC